MRRVIWVTLGGKTHLERLRTHLTFVAPPGVLLPPGRARLASMGRGPRTFVCPIQYKAGKGRFVGLPSKGAGAYMGRGAWRRLDTDRGHSSAWHSGSYR